jgi:peptidoglycan/xylan/chitin deacetylase (PgdA/CDA1 family)
MSNPAETRPCRRDFLATCLAAGIATTGAHARAPVADEKALIAISLDLEMSRNFPNWEETHWDYEKGNLDAPTKQYAVEAARRVKERGGLVHFFALGQTMEQPNVDWLRAIVAQGHPIGNHSYDHVNIKATRSEDIQFRFQRSPWLIEGKTPSEVIASNIRLAESALKSRIGIAPAGFRTPGGFNNGLVDRPDLQAMLLKFGYTWVSSKYPAHSMGKIGVFPDRSVMAAIVAAQAHAQPFRYPSGLLEVPMSPISDVTAFRAGRWPLEAFLQAIRLAISWAIEHRAVFSFLAHPSCLVVTDPGFQAIELICDLTRDAGDRAKLVDLGTLAQRAEKTTKFSSSPM